MLLGLKNKDSVQVCFYYRKNDSKTHRFSLCYQLVFDEGVSSLNIPDRAFVKALNDFFISNVLINYFAEDTFVFDLELSAFRNEQLFFKEKFGLRPPVRGTANSDAQVTYSGTYLAQFRQTQEGLPTVQLGRLRIFDFYVPKSLPDPEVILENHLFRETIDIVMGEGTLGLRFIGVTKGNYIDTSSKGFYVEERVR